jgi:hypothetical protein
MDIKFFYYYKINNHVIGEAFVEMASEVYAHIQTHELVYVVHVKTFVYQLHFRKVI